ncbi:hypothetical protein GJ496_005629 [Pomphorhynchus laevis]|nr:hypothetical protein GJ496_005629 [Pomphorhynchus laevis]
MREDRDEFLSLLENLFNDQKRTKMGSLHITLKRYDGRNNPKPKKSGNSRVSQSKGKPAIRSRNYQASSSPSRTSSDHTNTEYFCLFRAKLANKKVSTAISSKELTRFQTELANCMKRQMNTLKRKREKTIEDTKSKR